MNQMVQQMTQQKSNLSSIQLNLIKYCWSTLTPLQETTRSCIASCSDDMLLKRLNDILEQYIMPYYYVNRTIFNRIREHFVQLMYVCLTNQNVFSLSAYSFLLRYRDVCITTMAVFDESTKELSLSLIQKAKSEVTRLT